MSGPRVWDVIMYAGEADMLEMRLNELDGKVHRHVIAEAEVTHRGHPKPLWFAGERERFARWADRITYVVAKELPGGLDNWRREHVQRDAGRAGLHDAADEDLILISDADELPSDAALAWRGDKAAALVMTTCHSAVDLVYRQPQFAGVIARWGWARNRRLGDVRDGRYGYPVIQGAGWHLSWVGSQAYRRAKLDYATCHLEMPAAEWQAIQSGATYERGEHHAPDTDVIPVDIDESWPEWIRKRKCPADWWRPREAA
jgi:Glycosyltransferase family 17